MLWGFSSQLSTGEPHVAVGKHTAHRQAPSVACATMWQGLILQLDDFED